MDSEAFEVEIDGYIIGDVIKMETALAATLLNGVFNCPAMKALEERPIDKRLLKAILLIKIDEFDKLFEIAIHHLKNDINFIQSKNDRMIRTMNVSQEVTQISETLKKWNMVYEDRLDKTEYETFESFYNLERTIIECVGGTPIRPTFSTVAQKILDSSDRRLNVSRNYEKVLLEFEDFKMKCLTPRKAGSAMQLTPTYPVFNSEYARLDRT